MFKKIANNTLYSSIFMIVGVISNPFASRFIHSFFPERLPAHDLIFKLTPTILWTQYISDPLLLIGLAAFLVMIFRRFKNGHENIIRQVIFSTGLVLCLRAIMQVLTPMQRMETFNQPYGIFQVIQHGLFPSGHTAIAFLFYLYAQKLRPKKRWLVFFSFQLIAQIIVLLYSRGHYSVDIAGGLMIAYIAFRKTKDLTEEPFYNPRS